MSLCARETGVLQFRGNNTRTYAGDGEIPARAPQTLWKFRTGKTETANAIYPWEGLGWTGQPIVDREMGDWVVYFTALDGYAYKLDLERGRLLQKSPDNFYIIKSSPAMAGLYLTFGAWDNAVHFLNRYTLRHVYSDTAIWTSSASYDFDSSPAVEGDSLVYIGGEDGYVRKLSLNPEFHRVWQYPEEAPTSDFVYGKKKKPYVGIESSVAIAGNKLVVGTGSGEVWILDKRSGELLASYRTGDDTDGTPVIDVSDSSFYIGVEKDFTKNSGGLYKIGLDGRKRWFFPTGKKGVFSTAAIDSEKVVFTGDDRYLYALDKKRGKLLWKTALDDGSWSSPVMIGGRILAADYAGKLYGIDAASGEKLWEKKIGNYIVSSPIVLRGIILVGTRDGFIHALR